MSRSNTLFSRPCNSSARLGFKSGPFLPSPSTYQVVVEEELVKKVKRELGSQDCFPLPMSHGEAQARGTPHYYTAELPPSSLPEASPFTVGDNHTYNGYWNSPLDPRKSYLVYFQAMSNFRGVSVSVAADLATLPHRSAVALVLRRVNAERFLMRMCIY